MHHDLTKLPHDLDQDEGVCNAIVETRAAHARLHRGFVLGNYHPMVLNDSEAGRTFNRRIELRVAF
jgi:hypothetical protein